jgi:hypothetical protein
MPQQYITVNVQLCSTPDSMQQAVEQVLQQFGNPLNWLVVDVSDELQCVEVEAIVEVEE